MLYILFLLPLSVMGQSRAQVRQNRAVAERAEIEQLQQTWQRFAVALQHNDMEAIRSMSAGCIRCSNCTVSDTTTGSVLIPVDAFLQLQKAVFSDAAFLSLVNDNAKLTFHDNEVNATLYPDTCIAATVRLEHPVHKEVLVLYTGPSGSFESVQLAFAFVATREGYQFCGYSTIP